MTDPSPPAPETSVVVCTRNRSAKLLEACRGVLELEPPDHPWELLIVDNASTDDTPDVARRFATEHPGRVRVVEERELGLSAARNAGIRATPAERILFLDDDAFPDPGWLRALVAALDEPDVMAAGGPVDPWFLGELPDWFTDRYLPYVTAYDHGPEVFTLHYNEYPRGANVAYRRETFERYGDFSTHLGRKGDDLRSCEESELCLRLERAGHRVLYHPGARVRHQVDATRLTVPWMADRFLAQGKSEAIVAWQHGGVRELARGIVRYGKNALHASRQPGEENQTFAALQRTALGGFLRGIPLAMREVPRYRLPNGERSLERWSPEGPAGEWRHPKRLTPG